MQPADEFNKLTPVQKQVARTLHALCDLIDLTRNLPPRYRIDILKRTEDSIHTRIKNTQKIKDKLIENPKLRFSPIIKIKELINA